jgi:pseudouridine synthase
LISAGRVSVNGEVVTQLGSRVQPGDVVFLDGEAVEPEQLRYILLNKPAGVVTTASDPQGRRTVIDLVGGTTRVFPVGRLDIDTTGLLLITNDGELAHRLMHPRFEIDKVYLVEVAGLFTDDDVASLQHGVELEDGVTAPAQVRILSAGQAASTVELVIHEGRKRQVRRMMEALGHPVEKLHRSRYVMLNDNGIEPGEFRELEAEEVRELKQIAIRGN